MRIGLLTNYLALPGDADSGIGQHYRILADALVSAGHRVHVVHPTLHPNKAQAAVNSLSPAWTCDIVPVRTPKWLDRLLMRSWPGRVLLAEVCAALAANRALGRAVQKHSLEIIETHATGSPALIYLQRSNRPPVITRVSTTQSQMNAASAIHSRLKDWQVAIERLNVHSSDALVTHTRKHREAICALDGYNPRDFALIAHGLPDAAASPVPQAVIPKPDQPLEILFVGRFEHRKGIDVLLEAIPLVISEFPKVRFTLAGSPGDGKAWETFVHSHPALVERNVTAPGIVSAEVLDMLYARCDVFVAPSRYESFGLIYAEAMRHAKPVIGCDAGGIPEVVTDGVTGLLARPGDSASLATCLLRLLKDSSMRLRLGRAGLENFTRRFSATRMAKDSVTLYDGILGHLEKVI